MTATTTLNRLIKKNPWPDEELSLRARLGGLKGDDELFTLQSILAKNGLDDAMWCLVAADAPAEAVHAFGRACALDVARLWGAPPEVTEYLRTGDERLRDDASSAIQTIRAAAFAANDVEVDLGAAWAAKAVTADATDVLYSAWVGAFIAAKSARRSWPHVEKRQRARFIAMFCTESAS